jgi:hypothetical protein
VGDYGASVENLIPNCFLSRHLGGQRSSGIFRDDYDSNELPRATPERARDFDVRVHEYVLISNVSIGQPG